MNTYCNAIFTNYISWDRSGLVAVCFFLVSLFKLDPLFGPWVDVLSPTAFYSSISIHFSMHFSTPPHVQPTPHGRPFSLPVTQVGWTKEGEAGRITTPMLHVHNIQIHIQIDVAKPPIPQELVYDT